jgi:hypothetical protein
MLEERDEHYRDILERLHQLEASLPKDELGGPDYSGHRKFHRDQASAQANFEATRRKIVSNIISWAAIGVLTVVGSGVVQYILTTKPP